MLKLEEFKLKLSPFAIADLSEKYALEFFWCYEMTASQSEIWGYLSDTSRMNREMGFAPRKQTEQDGRLIVTTSMLGLDQQWLEEPWIWLANQTMATTRNYQKGLAKKMHSVFHIDSDPALDRRYVYIYFGWQPTNLFWKLFLRSTSNLLHNNFQKAFDKLEKHFKNISNKAQNVFQQAPQSLSKFALQNVERIRAQITAQKLSDDAADKLLQLVTTGDDFDLEPLRVLPLARAWKINEKELLTICLFATRFGLLNISWDVICPHCRGSRYSAQSLGEIPEVSNCEACNIEFSTDEANSIEVMFHVHPSIRKIEALQYCAAEPAKKIHIKIQHLIKPSQTLRITLKLNEGLYRARTTNHKWQSQVAIKSEHSNTQINLRLNAGNIEANSNSVLSFQNETNEVLQFIFEEQQWENSALKPAHILALPEFRDLFSEEHLSSNVKLYLGEQTILFTDIVGSTNFYKNVGDAKAFADVRTHFQEVFKEVQRHNGIIVKTIGDAVMASFSSTQEAITAAIDIQKCFYLTRSDTAIRLRISVHAGPVIAVHLNTGIDYFGNTVNLAAKIQSVAGAGEIALSKVVLGEFLKLKLQNLEVDKRINNRDGGISEDVFVLKSLTR